MNNLKTYLDTNGVKQAEFASVVGASQATISKLLNNVVLPSLDLAIRIERATDSAVPANSWSAAANPVATPTPTPEKDVA